MSFFTALGVSYRTALAIICASSFTLTIGCGDSGSGGAGGEPTTGGAGGGEGGEGGVGAGPACGTSLTCVVVPDGWNGPLQLETDDSGDPTCSDGYPITNFLGFAGEIEEAEPAECSCSCGEPTGASCSTPTAENVELTGGFEGAACGGTACAGDVTHQADTCIAVTQGACSLSKQVSTSAADVTAASCAADSTTIVPPAKWTERARICGTSPPAKCGDGVCVAKGPTCISQDGDVECPEGYDSKTVVYANADDTRGCSECSCGAVTGGTCEGTMTAHANGACDVALSTTAIPGCTPWLPTPATTHIKFNLEATGGDCAATGGLPEGDAVPAGAVTVCCAG